MTAWCSSPSDAGQIGLHIVLFEAYAAFTRVTVCTLALSPIRGTPIEGFNRDVAPHTRITFAQNC